MDGMEVDTDRMRDTVADLSALLVTTTRVVGQLRQTTVAASAFGVLGADVHAISGQVQERAATNIVDLSAVFEALNQRSAGFARDAAHLARCGEEGLRTLRPNSRR